MKYIQVCTYRIHVARGFSSDKNKRYIRKYAVSAIRSGMIFGHLPRCEFVPGSLTWWSYNIIV